jgi:hypothetical protein
MGDGIMFMSRVSRIDGEALYLPGWGIVYIMTRNLMNMQRIDGYSVGMYNQSVRCATLNRMNRLVMPIRDLSLTFVTAWSPV